MPRSTTVAKIVVLHESFLPCFLAFIEAKKIIKERVVYTLKHAVVNNNKF